MSSLWPFLWVRKQHFFSHYSVACLSSVYIRKDRPLHGLPPVTIALLTAGFDRTTDMQSILKRTPSLLVLPFPVWHPFPHLGTNSLRHFTWILCFLSPPNSEPRYTWEELKKKRVGLDRANPYDEAPVSTKSTPSLIFFLLLLVTVPRRSTQSVDFGRVDSLSMKIGPSEKVHLV